MVVTMTAGLRPRIEVPRWPRSRKRRARKSRSCGKRQARLKELETLEKVTEKIDKLTVFGGLDGVLKDVVRIHAPG
jgi:hypothetical protein